jgi:ferritin-like protein
MCRPLSADVKEYAQRIERAMREFVSISGASSPLLPAT